MMIEPSPKVVEKADLFRQRRMLLSLTFLLAAIHGLDVKLGTTMSTQGLVLTFERPGLLLLSLWIAWGWGLYRYWQHQRLYAAPWLEASRQAEGRPLVKSAVEKVINEAIDKGQYATRGLNPGDRVNCSLSDGKPLYLPSFDEDANFTSLTLRKVGDSKAVEGGGNCTLPPAVVRRIRSETSRRVVLKYPFFTDLFAPYVLALFAPVALAIDLTPRILALITLLK
jgi:hypothetical protein